VFRDLGFVIVKSFGLGVSIVHDYDQKEANKNRQAEHRDLESVRTSISMPLKDARTPAADR
ncbi:MAG: hypothetical protein AAF497_20135, partial [Planctomycetota bacterium]